MSSMLPGTRIGPYEVIGPLGAGGMGVVLRARDISLRRDVALKVLPPDLAGDGDSQARLAREARALATLNHPHIAQVYGLEASPAGPVIAMELVEGVTLRDRLRGGLSRADALRLAQQIAQALDAAHEKGIIHRDLKPGNIMVSADGVAKVLDFGLARSSASEVSADQATTLAPTLEGAIAGTPAYMSPEQARGQAVDRRTDVWAFGCILYELFAGRPPFEGATFSDLSAAILEREPDWSVLPADTPRHVVRMIQRCLRKDRRERLRDIGDALHELTAVNADVAPPPSRALPARGSRIALVAAGLAAGVFVTWLVMPGAVDATPSGVVRLELPPPASAAFGGAVSTIEAEVVAVSPDGATIAFIAQRRNEPPRIWVRALAEGAAREIPGTENAISLFFSPDGRAMGFFAGGQLRSITLAGGAPVKICNVPVNVGLSGSWGSQGDILFASVQAEKIWRVPAGGGSPVEAVSSPSEANARTLWPRHLPDGRRFLYSELPQGRVMLVGADGRRTTLVEAASQARWIEPDWLVFVREGTLVAQRIDLAAGRAIGEPVSILGSVAYSAATGWSNMAASPNGTIVTQWHLDDRRVAWFDAAGRELAPIGQPGPYATVRLSPEDESMLFARIRPELGTYDIWRTDLTRGSEQPVTTSPGMETGEVPVPGGQAVLYAAAQGGVPNLFHKDLVTGKERRLMTAPRFQFPNDVTPDGARVIYQQRTDAGTWDLMSLDVAEPGAPTPVLATEASEYGARLAPGGAAMAFTSNESGRLQVYVAPFPVTATRVQVSAGGGSTPRWRRDGRELYFMSSDRKLMAAAIDASGQPGQVRPLFDVPSWIDYDVARDGRFVAVVSQVVGAEEPLAVIVNWRR